MPRRNDLFIMRINRKERELLAELADREGTSASEAVRIVVRRAVEAMPERPVAQAMPAKA